MQSILRFNIVIQSTNVSVSIGPILYANRKSILDYMWKHDEISIDASIIVNRIDTNIVLLLVYVITRFQTTYLTLLLDVQI